MRDDCQIPDPEEREVQNPNVDLTRSEARTRLRRTHCDPAADPVVDEYFIPSGELSEGELAAVDTPLIRFQNSQVDLTCEDPPDGPDVRVDAGVIYTDFDWRVIPGMTRDRLDHFKTTWEAMTEPQQEAVKGYTANQLRTVFLLQESQAEWTELRFSSLTSSVADKAQTAAGSLLDCYWLNEEQVATCPDDEDTTARSTDNNPVTVDAGTIRSYDSLVDANEQAVAQAESLLVCEYGNDEVTRTCEDLGFPEEVPTNPTTGQVGSVVVSANTVYAASVEEANRQATLMAEAGLSCFYASAAINESCDDVVPAYDDLGAADIDAGTIGSSITIPLGHFTSTSSQAAADLEATTLRDALLQCRWSNDLLDLSCLDEAYQYTLPDERVMVPNEAATLKANGGDVTSWSHSIPAGEFISTTSKEDADNQALLYAQVRLNCIYCNLEVVPVCTPEEEDDPTSVDETEGIPANKYCGVDPDEIQLLADSLGGITIRSKSSGTGCQYGNTKVRARCVEPGTPPEGSGLYKWQFNTLGAKFDAGGNQTHAAPGGTLGPTIGLDATCTPDPSDETKWVEVAANQFLVSPDDVPAGFVVPASYVTTSGDPTDGEKARAYADFLATEMAFTMLNCFFTSPQISVRCGADYSDDTTQIPLTTAVTTPASGTVGDGNPLTYGDGKLHNAVDTTIPDVSDSAVGHIDKPSVVPPGVVSEISAKDAALQALALGFAALDCYVANAEATHTCEERLTSDPPHENWTTPDHPEAVASVDLAAGVVRSSFSQQDLDNNVSQLVGSLLNCCWTNDAIPAGSQSSDDEEADYNEFGPDVESRCGSLGDDFHNPGVAAGQVRVCNVVDGGKLQANLQGQTLTSSLLSCNDAVRSVAEEYALSVPPWHTKDDSPAIAECKMYYGEVNGIPANLTFGGAPMLPGQYSELPTITEDGFLYVVFLKYYDAVDGLIKAREPYLLFSTDELEDGLLWGVRKLQRVTLSGTDVTYSPYETDHIHIAERPETQRPRWEPVVRQARTSVEVNEGSLIAPSPADVQVVAVSRQEVTGFSEGDNYLYLKVWLDWTAVNRGQPYAKVSSADNPVMITSTDANLGATEAGNTTDLADPALAPPLIRYVKLGKVEVTDGIITDLEHVLKTDLWLPNETWMPRSYTEGSMISLDGSDAWVAFGPGSQTDVDGTLWDKFLVFNFNAGGSKKPEWQDFPQLDEGDMIYRDGDRLVKLPNPGAPSTVWFMTHDGTSPAWAAGVARTAITDIRLDATTGQIQVKTRSLVVLSSGTESDWVNKIEGAEYDCEEPT
jgi:hypothetical protein